MGKKMSGGISLGRAPKGQGYPGPGPKAGDSGLNKGSAGKPAPCSGDSCTGGKK